MNEDLTNQPAEADASGAHELRRGTVFAGTFRIEKLHGKGGMGLVYRATRLTDGQTVAVKVLGAAITDRSAMRRFAREAWAASTLDHPNIVHVHYAGQEENICFIVMDYVEGASFRRIINHLRQRENAEPLTTHDLARLAVEQATQFDRLDFLAETLPVELPAAEQDADGPLPHLVLQPDYHDWLCRHFARLAKALDYAHTRQVIHRDIKPDNILLGADGEPYLIDFGLAKSYEDSTITSSGTVMGTPMYLSPEQIRDRHLVDHRTDVYALGLTLYEMLTIHAPYPTHNIGEIFGKKLHDDLVPVTWRNPAVNKALEAVVHNAIHRNKDQRYATAAEFAEDLRQVTRSLKVKARPYNFRLDLRPVLINRPGGIVLLTFLLFTTAFAFFANVAVAVSDYVGGNEQNLTLAGFAGTICAWFAGGMFTAWTGRSLLDGAVWARWVTLVFSAVIVIMTAIVVVALIVFPAQMGAGGHTSAVAISGMIYLLGIAVTCSAILINRRTRVWFRSAAIRRNDYRQEQRRAAEARRTAALRTTESIEVT